PPPSALHSVCAAATLHEIVVQGWPARSCPRSPPEAVAPPRARADPRRPGRTTTGDCRAEAVAQGLAVSAAAVRASVRGREGVRTAAASTHGVRWSRLAG